LKKLAYVLMVLVVIGFSAGCIENGSHASSSPTGVQSYSPTSSSKSAGQIKKYSLDEFLNNLEKIKRFSYRENTSTVLNLTLTTGNLTQSRNVTVIYRRVRYVDLADRKADINTTTITFPSGVSTFTRDIIVGKDVYVFLGARWLKLTNETLGISLGALLNMTWKYNIVSFAGRYLQRKPFKEAFENGTQFLYYNITEEDLTAIAKAFIGNSNMTFNVTKGVLELRFRNGVLVGGRMGYRISVHIRGENLGKRVDVYEIGHVYDEFIIFDINVKKPVKVPQSYVS